jgi:dienelactone hydrolase
MLKSLMVPIWLTSVWLALDMAAADPEPLAGTAPLIMAGDIASNLVAGADRFLLRQIDESLEHRAEFWKRDFSSPGNYDKSIEPNRQRLAHIIGVRDPRRAFTAPEFIGQGPGDNRLAREEHHTVYAVRWPAFGDVTGQGLLLVPSTLAKGAEKSAFNVIAIPDADQTPEQIAGLVEGVPPDSQYARILADSGCLVLVPVLINRGVTHRQLSNREFLYRSAFEMGRHLIGYEVQKVLAAVDWFSRDAKSDQQSTSPACRIGVIGWGEGGLIALYAGALDPRIQAVCVSGYFDSRQNVWQEPVYRNVFGFLEQFGDAELASMIAPRALIIEAARAPEVVVPPGTGGAPGRLTTPSLESVRQEVERARRLSAGLHPKPTLELVVSGEGHGPFGSRETLRKFLDVLAPDRKLRLGEKTSSSLSGKFDPEPRHREQMHEIDRHNQRLLAESASVRQKFMTNLDTSSLEKYQASAAPYRKFFYDEVIGRFDQPLLAPNVRTRKSYDKEKWTGYEVVMDVFPDVIAYGILLVPKNLQPGERRPVVVCQHGLEGRPQHVVTREGFEGYKAFAAQLAEQGFITFAPQNLYLFEDRFRTLQRKANPLKKTLFSIIVPQHQQFTDWLKSLPFVDGNHIAFYGLSYGGKTAMRVPPLVNNYCLSICSGDFNEWVWKNATTASPYSYVWTGEYEIFEFDLGSTFNYAEMAALIAPRPFMVERGHFDGVAPDETVAYEFAKVRYLYEAKLGLTNQCRLEWFVGPHAIHGKGTFEFLHEQLLWPER